MRSPAVKAFSLGVITGSFLTAGLIHLAAPARADHDPVVIAYTTTFGEAVCLTLDDYPSKGGVLGVGQAIIEDGLTAFQAGQVIYFAVDELCPRHLDLVLSFAGDVTA